MEQAAREIFYHCLGRRDSERWPAFVRSHNRRMRRALIAALCRRGAGVTDEALDELMQELYCRLMVAARCRRNHLRQRSVDAAYSYLKRAADSVVLDHLRRRRRRYGRPRPQESETPEGRLLARERLRLFLDRCRRHLPPRQRELRLHALWLALFEGRSSREIARWSRGTLSAGQVDTMIHRLRRKLAAEGIHLARRGGRPRRC